MVTKKIWLVWWKKIVKTLQNFLTPEQKEIEQLLRMDPGTMRRLLPKSIVNNQNITTLFDYQNQIVRLIVKKIKFKNNASLRERIALYLTDEIIELASDIELFTGQSPILVPMPMSKKEKNKKGFNQCEELCREIKKINPNIKTAFDTLHKIRETARQTTLGRTARLINVKNSMHATKNKAANQTFIVLDDICTTFASFNEAKRALLEADAKKVFGLFIAH